MPQYVLSGYSPVIAIVYSSPADDPEDPLMTGGGGPGGGMNLSQILQDAFGLAGIAAPPGK